LLAIFRKIRGNLKACVEAAKPRGLMAVGPVLVFSTRQLTQRRLPSGRKLFPINRREI